MRLNSEFWGPKGKYSEGWRMGIQMTTGDDETAVGNHNANEGKEI